MDLDERLEKAFYFMGQHLLVCVNYFIPYAERFCGCRGLSGGPPKDRPMCEPLEPMHGVLLESKDWNLGKTTFVDVTKLSVLR